MICDLINVRKYVIYCYKPGPFVIVFYKEDSNKTNFQLYKFLKSLERKFNDVPIFRFNYEEFRSTFKDDNIKSENTVMVIENQQKTQYVDANEFSHIPRMLEEVRKKRLMKQNKNIYKKYRPYTVHLGQYKVSDIEYFINLSAELQYKFPNSTSKFIANQIKSKSSSKLCSRNKLQTKTSKIYTYEEKIKPFHISNISNKKIIDEDHMIIKSNEKYLQNVQIKSTNPNLSSELPLIKFNERNDLYKNGSQKQNIRSELLYISNFDDTEYNNSKLSGHCLTQIKSNNIENITSKLNPLLILNPLISHNSESLNIDNRNNISDSDICYESCQSLSCLSRNIENNDSIKCNTNRRNIIFKRFKYSQLKQNIK